MTFPTLIAVDVETTLNGNEDVGLAHPSHPDNYVVYVGSSTSGGDYGMTAEHSGAVSLSAVASVLCGYPANTTFCGCNFAFDLLYLYKLPGCKALFQSRKIWDVQLAEYILTGQRSKFSSLDELSKKYGLPLKEDKIKEYFKAGMGADKIPRDEIVPYLQQDVTNTWQIATKQRELAVQQNQLVLIESQMEALQATTEMMFNGLHIDQQALDAYTLEVVDEYVACKLDLEELVIGNIDDINSPKQWSQFFFGGKKRVKAKEAVGLFKNGNTKFKLVEKTVEIKPFVVYTPDPDKVSKATGQVSVDDAVLNDMLRAVEDPKALQIIKALLSYRELSKQLSTYVQGLGKHVINGFIYGKLNHTATVTGRLSSTNPNLQNISNNPIKKIFTSRFKDEGVIVEVDFNQLEVVALAHITGDKRLIEDISSGVDIHSALYEGLFGRKPSKEERKPFKARTFQLIYGAGAKAIAKQAGCSLEEARKFIEVFYTRYPAVAAWHTDFSRIVESKATHVRNEEGLLEKFKTCVHTTPTGRRFVFTEYYNDSTWSPKMYNFSPTEMKNYPVQGLATGDIVPMMLGKIFRKLVGRDDVLMVNTIHDSIMFDVKLSAIGEFLVDIKEILQNTHEFYKETFGHPLALKLNAGASYGVNWYNMKEV
jgi:DNA polymerase-1